MGYGSHLVCGCVCVGVGVGVGVCPTEILKEWLH